MPLIDLTYFEGEINIGQLDAIEVQTLINSFIKKYEAVYLKKVFGDTSIDTSTLSANEDILQAIAYYVYYHYVRNELYARSGIGETIPQAENANVVSPTYRAIYAYNEMVNYTCDGLEAITTEDIKNPFEYQNRYDL